MKGVARWLCIILIAFYASANVRVQTSSISLLLLVPQPMENTTFLTQILN